MPSCGQSLPVSSPWECVEERVNLPGLGSSIPAYSRERSVFKTGSQEVMLNSYNILLDKSVLYAGGTGPQGTSVISLCQGCYLCSTPIFALGAGA